MKTKRISAFPAQVDLQGLPAARLRSVLLAFSSPDAADVLDAQLADLHAEWLEVRERSRLRAAWLGLAIRAHVLTCAAYYLCVSLGVPALRNAAIFAVAACITLGLFLGLASLIAPRPVERIPAVPILPFTPLDPPKPSPGQSRPIKPAPPPEVPDARGLPIAVDEGDRGPRDDHPQDGPFDGPGWIDTEPLPPAPLTVPAMCLPMVRSEPDYPALALRRRIEGHVIVEVAIDRSGSVSKTSVVQAEPAGVFDDAVLRAVRRWRYKVSGDDAEASCDRAQVRLRFELPPGAR
jgi:protein TonB